MCGCIDDASSIFNRHTALQRTVEVGSGYENQRVLRPAPCSDINFFWLGEPVTCASPAAGILQQNTTVLQLPNIAECRILRTFCQLGVLRGCEKSAEPVE